MTTPVLSTPRLAERGSQRWLQIAVNQRASLLDEPLCQSAGLPAGSTIEWLSPLVSREYGEYRDHAFLDLLGLTGLKRPLRAFWPAGGPVWDGLARVAGTQTVFLVEAKAHIAEMLSGTSRAGNDSRELIERSLRAVQKSLAPRSGMDWAAVPFYQYVNRLAHLHFLRVDNGVDAHLVNVYFTHADDMGGPAERAEWEGAVRLLETQLGLGRHKLAEYVHEIFVDTRELRDGPTSTPTGLRSEAPARAVRLVAWNLGHQTREKVIPAGFLDAVRRLNPDVLTLNEYVHGTSRTPLLEALRAAGLAHHLVSERIGTNNQVLIASREPLVAGDLRGPETESGGGASNFLHAAIPTLGLEVVALRAPAYRGQVLRDYWDALAPVIRGAAKRRIVFLGDLNADPERPSQIGGQRLAQLRSEGWHLPAAIGAWSFKSGSRIDHVLASALVRMPSATYVAELDGLRLAGGEPDALSDHAALVVDFPPGAP